jgi:hypothetical protein
VPAMTANDDAEFAETDRYISRQLDEAAARLGTCTDRHAQLQDVIRAASYGSKHSDEADVPPEA